MKGCVDWKSHIRVRNGVEGGEECVWCGVEGCLWCERVCVVWKGLFGVWFGRVCGLGGCVVWRVCVVWNGSGVEGCVGCGVKGFVD